MTMAFVPSSVVVPEQQHWHHQDRRTRPRRVADVASVTSATQGGGWRSLATVPPLFYYVERRRYTAV